MASAWANRKDGLRQTVEFPEAFNVPSYDRFYKMRMVAAGDLTDAPGAEIVLLEGCEIRLLDRRGQLLAAASAPFGFTDVVYVEGSPRGHVLLGSSPNGDDNVYRVRFDDGWEQALAALQRRGFMADVEEDLRNLAGAIDGWVGQPLEGADGLEQHGANGHHPEWWNEDGTDARSWAFDRLDTYWAMAPLPETDVSTLLWGRTRRTSENIVTTSTHGFVCVVPGGVTLRVPAGVMRLLDARRD